MIKYLLKKGNILNKINLVLLGKKIQIDELPNLKFKLTPYYAQLLYKGKLISREIPKDISKKITPINNSFSPSLKNFFYENNNLYLIVSSFLGTYRGNSENFYFMTRINNYKMDFAEIMHYRHSNSPPRFLGLINDSQTENSKDFLFCDTRNTNLNENVIQFQNAMKELTEGNKKAKTETIYFKYIDNLKLEKILSDVGPIPTDCIELKYQ